MSAAPRVIVVMGSDSDLPTMRTCLDVLTKFGLPWEVRVCSAHRTPEEAVRLSREARGRGIQAIIAAAGGAAHLAGVLAAHTTLPVIGVPINSTPLNGVDALYATVQMPPGIPVATVAIGEFGAYNAAVLAAQIIGVADEDMQSRLSEFKRDMEAKVRQKDVQLQEKVKSSAP